MQGNKMALQAPSIGYEVAAAVAAGIVGASILGIYLVISLAVFFHIPPLSLFEWDTSNIVGVHTAIAYGWAGVPIGQLAHYVVSICWAALFIVAARYQKAPLEHPFIAGVVYGALVMVVMAFVVVPLGHAPRVPDTTATLLNKVVAHTLFFGVPVAYTARFMLARAKGGASRFV